MYLAEQDLKLGLVWIRGCWLIKRHRTPKISEPVAFLHGSFRIAPSSPVINPVEHEAGKQRCNTNANHQVLQSGRSRLYDLRHYNSRRFCHGQFLRYT